MKKISKKGLTALLILSLLANIGMYVYGQSLTNEIASQREEIADLNAQYKLLQAEYQEQSYQINK
ncbi:hypothetical protein [Coprobacillus sp. AF33-1AC]|uniref:hypothetical protein n=1 Tax=Coprobacillus sp. AF33-1AC TaxID=2292032 RepID=UPI000E527BC3|nr:hypothetical protein [Coprobacillus sp. AF33-1AC]RHM59680.1 hypothetical protein DWZ53_09040 [Coprobacillus sp. AF33-1AC]